MIEVNSPRLLDPRGRGRKRRPGLHGLPVHRGADLAPRRAVPLLQRHPGGHAPALECGGRRERRAPPEQQGQRHDAGCRSQPLHLRARDQRAGARDAVRRAPGARLALQRQGAEQPQRRHREVRRFGLLLRSVVRPHAGLRRGAREGAGLSSRLPHRAQRRAALRGGRLRPAQRLSASRRTRASSTSTTPRAPTFGCSTWAPTARSPTGACSPRTSATANWRTAWWTA